MINVSDITKELYLQGSVPRTLTITIPNKNITIQNEDILSETMKITESISSGNNLDFKGCIATVFQIKTVDIIQNITGEYITVDITIRGGDTIPLFRGYVEEVTNPTHEDVTCKITAYDVLYKLSNTDVLSWYNGLTFPITVKNFRDSLCNHLGITQVTTTLPNDNFSLNKKIESKTLNAIDVLRDICQINARFGRINREGKFDYVKLRPISEGLYPANDLYPDDELYPSEENANIFVSKEGYQTISYEPYNTELITGVNVYKTDGTLVDSAGTNTELFNVSDNFLVDGLTSYTDFAQNIRNEIFQIKFIPAKITLTAYPYIEIGDTIAVNTRKRIVRTYILTRTMTGIQGMKDLFESKSDQYQPEYKQSLAAKVSNNTTQIQTTNINLNNNVTRLDGRIDSTNSSLSSNVTRLDGRIDSTNSSLSSNVTRLDGRIDSTNSDLSSLSSTVTGIGNRTSTLETKTGNLETSLGNLQSIAITTSNWANQHVTSSMIDSLDASKLTGKIDNGRLNSNLGNRTFGEITCNNIATSKFKNKDVAWTALMGYWVLTGGRSAE